MSFWEAFFLFAIFVPMLIVWALSLWDVFSRPGMSGIRRAVWVVVIIAFPLIGTLAYLVARGPKESPTGDRGVAREAGRVV